MSDETIRDPKSPTVAAPGAPDARDGTVEAHGMRPVAIAFALGNVAILGVFAWLVATGALEIGATDAVAALRN